MNKKRLVCYPARPGYTIQKDIEATKKYGIRCIKWVPVSSEKSNDKKSK